MASAKTVLITGAAHGLGAELVRQFLDQGFTVFATDIDEEGLRHLPALPKLSCLGLDVASVAETARVAGIVQQQTGRLDVLVSNAGFFDFYPLSEAGSERLEEMFSVNVFGLPNLVKAFLPLLAEGSRLIVISSESYRVPSPFQPYNVSKQALEVLYRALEIELSLKGIRCILVRPGAMQTRLLDEALRTDRHLENSRFQKEFRRFLQSVHRYIGKVTEPSAVAEKVVKIATAGKPKAVYNINHNPLVSLLSALPRRVVKRLIRKSLRS